MYIKIVNGQFVEINGQPPVPFLAEPHHLNGDPQPENENWIYISSGSTIIEQAKKQIYGNN